MAAAVEAFVLAPADGDAFRARRDNRPELPQRLAARLLRFQAACPQFFDLGFQVKAELFVHVRFGVGSPESEVPSPRALVRHEFILPQLP
jgi:hypothetical protein